MEITEHVSLLLVSLSFLGFWVSEGVARCLLESTSIIRRGCIIMFGSHFLRNFLYYAIPYQGVLMGVVNLQFN